MQGETIRMNFGSEKKIVKNCGMAVHKEHYNRAPLACIKGNRGSLTNVQRLSKLHIDIPHSFR